MCISTYVLCICVYKYTRMYTYLHVYVYIYIDGVNSYYLNLHDHDLYMCINIYVCIHIYICMYIHMYTSTLYTFLCIYKFTHINIDINQEK
jgi:hypothetical protein